MTALEHAQELPRYASFSPTGFDVRGLGLEDRQEWFVVPVTQNRDSGIRDLSNFRSLLRTLGGEGEHVEVHRFGHWACGWLEIIIVDPQAPEKLLTDLGGCVCALADYPILNESDFSEMEEESCEKIWNESSIRDRLHYLRLFFRRRSGENISYLAARHEWSRFCDLYHNADISELRDLLLRP